MAIIAVLAPICAAIQLWARRHRHHHTRERVLEVFLVWWLALAVGVTSLIGTAYHVFDGPATAEMIGFTRGDGGFQFENAMGDLAIGVLAVLCIWIRGKFWLATIIFLSIQYYGDAIGHVYQWVHYDNTHSGNIGAPLYLDVILPLVATILYIALVRAQRGRDGAPAAAEPVSPPREAPVLVGDR